MMILLKVTLLMPIDNPNAEDASKVQGQGGYHFLYFVGLGRFWSMMGFKLFLSNPIASFIVRY